MQFDFPALNFPEFDIPVKIIQKQLFLFDPVRKIEVKATPEEWVRQHCIQYVLRVKKFPVHRILVEKELKVLGLRKRFDVLVIDKNGKGEFLIECKAPEVLLDQRTFDQIGRYNLEIGASVLWITNGKEHYMFEYSQADNKYSAIPDLPKFKSEC